jgi:glutaredoxin-like protein NrdH
MHKVMLYALSTCVWCKRTKRFLDEHSITYDCIDVDLLDGDEKSRVMTEVKRWNPRQSFPTLVIDDQTVLVGFQEGRLREVLEV